MGLKVRGGMWCDTCQKPVAGQKSTAKVAKLTATVMTGGTYPALPGAFHCPTCGSPVRRVFSDQQAQERLGIFLLIVIVVVVCCVIAAIRAIVHAL
jgi:hypothetical protein